MTCSGGQRGDNRFRTCVHGSAITGLIGPEFPTRQLAPVSVARVMNPPGGTLFLPVCPSARLPAALCVHGCVYLFDQANTGFSCLLPPCTIRADSTTNTVITTDIVRGVPVENAASSSEETTPLPYCRAPISAAALPAL